MSLTEEQAMMKAQALCVVLGPGWEPRVWDNLGWRWCAETEDRLSRVWQTGDRWWAQAQSTIPASWGSTPLEAWRETALQVSIRTAEQVRDLVRTQRVTARMERGRSVYLPEEGRG